jgi:phospholipid transport system substrate-binding protein
MRRILILSIVPALAGMLLMSRPAGAGVPTDQVKGSIDRVLVLLQDSALAKPERSLERRKQVRAVANELFDWQETGKRALARHWQTRTPQQREEFSALFADLIERSYVGKIEAYSGEKIIYVGEKVEGDNATVNTKLLTKSGTEIPIDYRLQLEGQQWRVYDVVIEGVSLVANYRTQFNRIITQSGYDELIKRMKTKQEEITFEEAEKAKKKP